MADAVSCAWWPVNSSFTGLSSGNARESRYAWCHIKLLSVACSCMTTWLSDAMSLRQEQATELCSYKQKYARAISKLSQTKTGVLQGHSTKAQDPGAWATGIVEVALPVEYKMRNIEETEAAKRRLLHASRSAVQSWSL